MNRRTFLQGAGVASTALAVVASAGLAPAAEGQELALPPMHRFGSGLHRLGPKPTTVAEKLTDAMSVDVFGRLCNHFNGRRTFRVLDCSRVGEGRSEYLGDDTYEYDFLTAQFNCGYAVIPAYLREGMQPRFPIEEFRAKTETWMVGCALYIGEDGTPTREAFKDKRLMGIPVLPLVGDHWACNYLHENTGLVMRAVATHDLTMDMLVARWDVLCG